MYTHSYSSFSTNSSVNRHQGWFHFLAFEHEVRINTNDQVSLYGMESFGTIIKSGYGHWDEMAPTILGYLNTWSLVGSGLEKIRGCGLVGGCVSLEGSLRFQEPRTTSSALSTTCFWLRMQTLSWPGCHAFSLSLWSLIP